MSKIDMTVPVTEADGYTPTIIAKIENGVGWMIFSNPRRRNAVTYKMWCQIPDVIAAFASNPEVKVIALRGEGDASFVSGADISEFDTMRSTPEQVATYDEAGRKASTAIESVEKPTVAIIQTWCIGGGVATALNCDLRIASEGSCFGVPAARLGLGYRYNGIKALVDVVGPAHAREIFFTARKYSTKEALLMGLINRVFQIDGFDVAVDDYLADIASNAPMTISSSKMAMRAVTKDPSERDIEAINAAVVACFESEDYQEGRRAFLEKREPMFRGR
jgi:enoyl-CoA hydratase/carnithine racemase